MASLDPAKSQVAKQREIEAKRRRAMARNHRKRMRAAADKIRPASDRPEDIERANEARRRALIKQARAEDRYEQQHLVASYRRMAAAQAFDAVREISPEGAYWLLDVTAKTHTKGCLFMAGRNWPWSVLQRVHPLRHPGCRCTLIPASDAAGWGTEREAAHIVMESARGPRHDEDHDGPWGLRSLERLDG